MDIYDFFSERGDEFLPQNVHESGQRNYVWLMSGDFVGHCLIKQLARGKPRAFDVNCRNAMSACPLQAPGVGPVADYSNNFSVQGFLVNSVKN